MTPAASLASSDHALHSRGSVHPSAKAKRLHLASQQLALTGSRKRRGSPPRLVASDQTLQTYSTSTARLSCGSDRALDAALDGAGG